MVSSWQHNAARHARQEPELLEQGRRSRTRHRRLRRQHQHADQRVHADRVARVPEGRHRLLAPSRRATSAPSQDNPSTKDGKWTVKGYPSTAVVLHRRLDEQADRSAEREPPDPRGAQHGGGPQRPSSNIVNEGISIPSDGIVPVSIPGYVPEPEPVPDRPTKAQAKLDKFTGTLPQNIPYWFNSGAGHDKIAQALHRRLDRRPCRTLTFKLKDRERRYWTRRPEQGQRYCAWAGSRTTRRSTTSSTCSPTAGRHVRHLQLVQQPAGRQAASSRRAPPRTRRSATTSTTGREADPDRRPVRPRRTRTATLRVTNNRIGGFLQLVRASSTCGSCGSSSRAAGCPHGATE